MGGREVAAVAFRSAFLFPQENMEVHAWSFGGGDLFEVSGAGCGCGMSNGGGRVVERRGEQGKGVRKWNICTGFRQ